MKKLVFREVSILSKVEKAGRAETFDPGTDLGGRLAAIEILHALTG
jgi:hypothetical protein